MKLLCVYLSIPLRKAGTKQLLNQLQNNRPYTLRLTFINSSSGKKWRWLLHVDLLWTVKHKHKINTALVQTFFFGSQTKHSVCKVWEYSSSAAPPGRIHSHPPSPSRSPYCLPLCSLFLLWLSTVVFPHLVSYWTLKTFSISHLLLSRLSFLLFFSAGFCWMILKGIVFDPFTTLYFSDLESGNIF